MATDGRVVAGAPTLPLTSTGRLAGLARRVRVDSLARNSFGIMSTSAVNAILGYIYWTAAARLMPPSAVGLGSAIVSAMVILSLAVHLGVGGSLTARLPGRTSRQDWLSTTLSTQLACTAAATLLAVASLLPLALLLTSLRSLATDPALAAWFVAGAAGWTASGLLDYTFIAQRRSELMFWRNAVSSAVKLLALLAAALLPGPPTAVDLVATWSLSSIAGTVCGLTICHLRIHRLGRVRAAAMRGELARLVRPSLGHHAISIGGLLPTYLLPVVVAARLDTRQDAYFYVTWMVGSSIFMISPAVSSAIFAEGSHDACRLRHLSVASLRIITAIIVPAVATVAAVGGPILSIFGARYAAEGYRLLLVLLLSSLPDAITNIAVATLRVRRQLRTAAALNGAMACAAVGGAWILAPRLGILGAGLAWLCAQTGGALAVAVLHRTLWPPKDPEHVQQDPEQAPAAPTPAPRAKRDL